VALHLAGRTSRRADVRRRAGAPFRTRRATSIAAALALSTLLAGTVALPSAGAAPSRHRLVRTSGASGGGATGSSFTAISCPTASTCTAVGQVGAAAGPLALIYQQVAGSWSSVTAPLPPGASAAHPGADLLAVACAAPGSCVAVGSYTNTTGGGTTGQQALIDVETGGVWSAVRTPLPANASTSSNNTLGAVSCASSGSCVAVGSYAETGGNEQALLVVESAGVWSAVPAPLPTGANGANANNALDGVTCTSNTDCVAVGDYVATVPGSTCTNHACQLALLDVETSGVWSSQIVPLPSNATAGPATGDLLSAVSCPSTGECVAVGSYVDTKGNNRALLDVETAGTWGAVAAPLPAGASAAPNTNALVSVTCTAVGTCVAVGQYDNTSEFPEGLIEDDVGGAWSPVSAPTPSDGRALQPDVALNSVSCAPGAGCVAVGSYVTNLGDLHPRALVDAQLGGTWTAGYVQLPNDASRAQPYSTLSQVDCTTATTCVAVGLYVTLKNVPGVLLDAWSIALTSIPVAPAAPTNVVAVAGHGQATIRWTASASDGGSPITGYTATASPGGATCTTTGATTCRLWPLSGNASYSFTVSAENELGSSPQSASTRGLLVPTAVATRTTVGPFAPNSALLTGALRAEIVAFAKRIVPYGGTVVSVVGYSDNRASPAASLLVSRRRALAVVACLRHQFGVLRISGIAVMISQLGSADPVASNATPAGRAKNRRVVMTLS
jgi:outer membrane protein OmpA-like peptidoglycan-associated protein